MNATNELLAIAQIAIALAGFSAVVAAFFQGHGLNLADRIRFVGIFAIAFVTLLLAFLPIALQHAGLSGSRLWVGSSSTMVVVWCAGMWDLGRRWRTMTNLLPGESTVPILLIFVPASANLAVQVCNVGGWLWEPNFVGYLFGLLCYLYTAGVGFVLVVLYRPQRAS